MNRDAYGTDILEWCEQQAALLCRVATGGRINDRVDWENIIEEVESVGSEQLLATQSLLVRALPHMLRPEGSPRRAMRRAGGPTRSASVKGQRHGSCPARQATRAGLLDYCARLPLQREV
jgi:hypothetical protein